MTTVAGESRTTGGVTVGEELGELAIPIDRTLIVATAIASRDYQDVHHDPGLAAERGSRDVFMNILTTNGLVERYVRGWAGSGAVVTAIRIRLGAPNYPGDTMLLTGTVTAVDGSEVEIAVRGDNELGTHVSGAVRVRLPGGPR